MNPFGRAIFNLPNLSIDAREHFREMRWQFHPHTFFVHLPEPEAKQPPHLPTMLESDPVHMPATRQKRERSRNFGVHRWSAIICCMNDGRDKAEYFGLGFIVGIIFTLAAEALLWVVKHHPLS